MGERAEGAVFIPKRANRRGQFPNIPVNRELRPHILFLLTSYVLPIFCADVLVHYQFDLRGTVTFASESLIPRNSQPIYTADKPPHKLIFATNNRNKPQPHLRLEWKSAAMSRHCSNTVPRSARATTLRTGAVATT